MSSSSSSSSEFELESAYRRLVHFVVEHSDGSEETVPAGGLAFVGGANVGFSVPDDDTEITMALDPGAGNEDPYYRDKYNGLISIRPGTSASGVAVADDRPAWLFTDETCYVTSINNVFAEPLSGALFIVGDACLNVGQFEAAANAGYPEDPQVWGGGASSSSSPGVAVEVGGRLSIFNMCIPCVDCLSFYQLETYLDRIGLFYDYIFDLTYTDDTVTPPTPPGSGAAESFLGTQQQVMSTLRYWDFLVSRSTVKLSAQSFGQSVVGAGFYRNISDRSIGALPNGVTLTFTFTFEKIDSGGIVTDWDGISAATVDVQILDRASRCSASLGPAGITFIGSNEVQVETKSGGLLGSSQEVYSDVALVLLGTELGNDPNYSHQVVVTLDVSHTHLGPVGLPNPEQKITLVYFRPPDPEPSA